MFEMISTTANVFSAIGTVGAVWVSLWLAYKSNREEIKTLCFKSIVFGVNQIPAITIRITNVASVPTTITNIGWRVGKNKKTATHAIQPFYSQFSKQVPIILTPSQQADFIIETDVVTWYQEFAKMGIKEQCENFENLYCQVFTTTGKVFEVKPDHKIIDAIHEQIEIIKKTPLVPKKLETK